MNYTLVQSRRFADAARSRLSQHQIELATSTRVAFHADKSTFQGFCDQLSRL